MLSFFLAAIGLVVQVIPPCSGRLQVRYQNLVIDQSSTTIGWNDVEECSTYIIEVFTLDEILTDMLMSPTLTFTTNTTRIKIYNSVLVDEPAYFRLTGVDENGNYCSDITSDVTFYGFLLDEPGTKEVEANTDKNSCFPVPEPETCSGEDIYIIFPDQPNSDSECSCYPSENIIQPLKVCACMCMSYLDIYNDENGSVCFNHTDQPVDPIPVLFLCMTNQCRTQPKDCFIEEVLSSYKIHVVGPPYGVKYYSPSNDSLCFNASSNPPYDVLYFTLDVSQHDSIVMSFNTSDCINITTENVSSYVDACKPYRILVTATNGIRTSDPTAIADVFMITCEKSIVEILLIGLLGGLLPGSVIILVSIVVLVCIIRLCCKKKKMKELSTELEVSTEVSTNDYRQY